MALPPPPPLTLSSFFDTPGEGESPRRKRRGVINKPFSWSRRRRLLHLPIATPSLPRRRRRLRRWWWWWSRRRRVGGREREREEKGEEAGPPQQSNPSKQPEKKAALLSPLFPLRLLVFIHLLSKAGRGGGGRVPQCYFILFSSCSFRPLLAPTFSLSPRGAA